MGYLDYSSETQTNIFPKENFEELVFDVFNVISNNICKSLGPLGSSATILEGLVEPVATKDGYTILDKYKFRNDYKRMIYNLIKRPCTKTNNTVGDGTTTVIALTTELFNNYKARKNDLDTLYRLPRQFVKTWDDIINSLQSKIMDKSVQINPKDSDIIYNIAYVASNGNKDISNSIKDVYFESDSPDIKKKDSPTNKSYIERIVGFNFPANLISESYVRNEDMTAEENNLAVMVFNFKLETDFFENIIIPINEVFKAQGTKLLVIAPSFDSLMCDTLLQQYVAVERRTTGINLICAQYSMSKLKPKQLTDLCVILKTKLINESIASIIVDEIKNKSVDEIVEKSSNDISYKLSRIFGKAEYALLSTVSGALFRVSDDIYNDDDYNDALRSANNTLETLMKETSSELQSYSEKIYDAKSRILQLKMINYIYYIGADSKLQKSILWGSITDVIKCVKSAVKYGVVPGCQLAIIRSCDELVNEIIESYGNINYNDLPNDVMLKIEIILIIKRACCQVYNKVLNGPDGMGMIKLLPRWQYTKEEGIKDLTKEAFDKCMDIVNKSIENNVVFDLETLEFNNKIITSAQTDIMVLLSASELVKILISTNQAIILRTDVDSSHEEQINC